MKRSAVAILAAAMLLSSVNIPGALTGTPAVVNAEGVDETDLHTLTDADNTDDSTMNISNFQEADPFIQTSVFELYNSGNLFVNNEKIKLEAFEESGVCVSGKNKDMQSGYLTLGKMYDFGETGATTFKVDALAKRAKKVFARFYLDEESTPFAEIKLDMQKAKDDWSYDGSKLVSIPNGIPAGQHYISVQFYDPDTEADKKTEVLFRNIQFCKSTGLPVVDINIDESYTPISDMNNDPAHNTECYGKISISVPEGFKSGYSDEGMTEYTGGEYKLDYIRGRGNSTWWADKKPYKIKLDEDANLFGMGTNKHWTLIANYYDNSLLRNRITYYLGEKLGMEYTPQLVPVDVNMNGNYIGSYYLCEQIRVGNSRVDIDDLENITSDDADITGGYLLGMSPYGDEKGYKFSTNRGSSFVVESPEEISSKKVSSSKLDEMNSYIEDYMNKTEDAIFGEDFKDSEGKSYTEYMDIDSAAKYYLIQEFSQNGDAFISPSTYLYKKKGGKLYWGPLWDFDYVAWASTDYSDYDENEGSYSGFVFRSEWFIRLMADKQFRNKMYEVWGGKDSTDPNTLAYQLNELIKDGGVLDQYEAQMTASAENNFAKWGMTSFYYGDMVDMDGSIYDEYGYPIDIPDSFVENGYYGPYANMTTTQCETYAQEVARLKKWISKRIDWVDKYLSDLSGDGYKMTFLDGDGNVYTERNAFPGFAIGELPEGPEKEGYVFDGWYVEADISPEAPEGELRLTVNTEISEACTVYPKYISESEVAPVKKIVLLEKEIYVPAGFQVWHINYSLIPAGANGTYITTTSSDPESLYVEDDVFGAFEPGDYEIKLTAPNGVEETLIVHALYPGEIFPGAVSYEADTDNVELNEGEYQLVHFNAVGDYADVVERYPMSFSIFSLDPDIAEMTPGGVINAYKPGKTTIAVIDNDSKEVMKIAVTVKGDAEDSKDKEDKNKDNKDNKDSKDNKSSEKTDSKSQEKTTEKAPDKTTEAPKTDEVTALKKGTEFNSGKLRYEVTKAGKLKNGKVTGGKVKVVGLTSDSKKAKKVTAVSIPATVKSENNEFKVTEIAANAFTGNEKIKSVTIGKNVTKIGKCAFCECENLKKVTVKGNSTKVNKKAFSGTSKDIKAYVPGAKISAYKKRLSKAGIDKSHIYKTKPAGNITKKSKTDSKSKTNKKGK